MVDPAAVARAVTVNPVDWIIRVSSGLAYGWLDYPAVLGFDVAGDVLAVGVEVDRVRPGDRVLGLALGVEKGHGPREGAFQHEVVLQQQGVVPPPPELSFENACVVPLATATAACGLRPVQAPRPAPPHSGPLTGGA